MDAIKINKAICLPYKDDLVAIYPEIFQLLDNNPPVNLLVAVKTMDYAKLRDCALLVPNGISIVRNV